MGAALPGFTHRSSAVGGFRGAWPLGAMGAEAGGGAATVAAEGARPILSMSICIVERHHHRYMNMYY